jgi:hypothetical protein
MKHKKSTNSMNGRFRVSVIDSEKGVVLVMVLILSVISLSFMAALMLMATTRTQISPARYASACEIVKAADDIFRQAVDERGLPAVAGSTTFASNNFSFPALSMSSPVVGEDCFTAKLKNATAVWNSGCSDSVVIDPAVSGSFDMSFDLSGANATYAVYAKIADTVLGNSSGSSSGGLVTDMGVVHSTAGDDSITVPHEPFLYTVEVLAVAQTSTGEECRLTNLYQF